MGLARYVVDAVVVEGRSPTEIARQHGISRAWLYQLLARYRAGGYPALEPRSRRPHSTPGRTPPEVEVAILHLRSELTEAGHDAGPATIAHHLAQRLGESPSPATIWRILRRHGRVTPSRTSDRARRSSASRRPCPTSCGRPTRPTGVWPTAPMSRSSTSSTITPGCASRPMPSGRSRRSMSCAPSTPRPTVMACRPPC